MTNLRPEFILTPAQQHTFCNKALIAIHAALDQYDSGASTGLDKHIAKIRRWLAVLLKSTRTPYSWATTCLWS